MAKTAACGDAGIRRVVNVRADEDIKSCVVVITEATLVFQGFPTWNNKSKVNNMSLVANLN